MAERTLTLRELNRALLARQLLLERRRLSVPKAIERLGALQAQWSPAPYVALWSRLDGFSVAQLERSLARRTVIKATLMRSTLHLVSSADYPVYAAAIVAARRPRVERQFPVDLDAVAERLRAASEEQRSWDEWREIAIGLANRPIKPGEIWPLWTVAFMHTRLVHLPPSGSYRLTKGATYRPYDEWVGDPKLPASPMAHTATRHLAAFGPATVDDISSWLGVPTPAIRAVLDDVAPRRFRDEGGRLLYDLERAPRPDGSTPAPARLLAKWDSPLLAYAPPERSRILPDAYRKRVIAPNGDVAQTFLVDGFVAGTWKVDKGRFLVEPFARLPASTRRALEAEGERLLGFLP